MLPPVCNNDADIRAAAAAAAAAEAAAAVATRPTGTPRTTDTATQRIPINMDIFSTFIIPSLPLTTVGSRATTTSYNPSSLLTRRSRGVDATMEAVRIVSLALDIIDGNDDDDGAQTTKKTRRTAAKDPFFRRQ